MKPPTEKKAPEFYDIWDNVEMDAAAALRQRLHVPAPKVALPGECESYLKRRGKKEKWEENG